MGHIIWIVSSDTVQSHKLWRYFDATFPEAIIWQFYTGKDALTHEGDEPTIVILTQKISADGWPHWGLLIAEQIRALHPRASVNYVGPEDDRSECAQENVRFILESSFPRGWWT